MVEVSGIKQHVNTVNYIIPVSYILYTVIVVSTSAIGRKSERQKHQNLQNFSILPDPQIRLYKIHVLNT